MFTTATPMISGFTARKMPHIPTRVHEQGHSNHKLPGWQGGHASLKPSLMGDTAFKIPQYSLFRPKSGQKTTKFFSHFHCLVPDTNNKHLECFVMLGTHSEPCRGQMSHICDISPLRVNVQHVH